MLLRNYYCALAVRLSGNQGASVANYGGVKNYSGNSPSEINSAMSSWTDIVTSQTSYAYCDYPSIQTPRTAIGGLGGVIFGNGTEPVMFDDYCLSGDIISTFTYATAMSYKYDDDGVTVSATYTLTNTGSEPFTISEIGLIATSYTPGRGYQNNSTVNECLIERTLLDEPVTIPAGGVGRVTYTIRMEYPTA